MIRMRGLDCAVMYNFIHRKHTPEKGGVMDEGCNVVFAEESTTDFIISMSERQKEMRL